MTPRPDAATSGAGSEQDAEWVLVAEGTRDDGDNDAPRRNLLDQYPELGKDPATELRLDLVCARNGTATLRTWKRPRSRPAGRRKPRRRG